MIRRLRASKLPLTIDEYVRRATLGLPKAERLDAAAELRAHLLERVTEHQQRGFSREEAEFLAVRGMGDVAAAHPQLWRERMQVAGWVVLALLVLGGGGWYAQREWMPPQEGVKMEAANATDTQHLFTMPDAPRGMYQAATLTLPKGTRTLLYVSAAASDDGKWVNIQPASKDITQETQQNISGRVPGSYRYQERWLWTVQHLTCQGQPRARLWLTGQTLPSPFWNTGIESRSGLSTSVGDCNNPSVRLYPYKNDVRDASGKRATVSAEGDGSIISKGHFELHLNHWTVLARLNAMPEGAKLGTKTTRGSYLAVMPLDSAVDYSYEFRNSPGHPRLIARDGRTLALPEVNASIHEVGEAALP